MTERIPLIKPVVGKEELSRVKEVLDSGYMTEGPRTAEFEERFADAVDADHGIAATSCTTALELCLRVLDIGPGDEVVVPDFTHPATADVVEMVGAETVLVDVERDTYNTAPGLVEEAITDDTAAIMPVSLFGNPLDYPAFRDLAEEYDVALIEDAACTAGAAFDGVRTGSGADLSCFSFHPRKSITTGEGGMITTDDDDLAEEIRAIKEFGSKPGSDGKPVFYREGTNYKLSDILSAVGLAQLDKMEDITERRRELARRYDDLLADVADVTPPGTLDGGDHSYQTYAVYLETEGVRDDVISAMAEDDIETQIGTYALHLQPAFEDAGRPGNLETSEKLYENLLTLPMCHDMTREDQERVVDTLQTVLEDLR